MSTRGVIAVGTLHNWKGTYNHSDSYPTGLGKEIYEHLTVEKLASKSLAEIAESFLRFDGWANYRQGGICEYCGKFTGYRHTISGTIYGKQLYPELKTEAELREYFSEPVIPGRQPDKATVSRSVKEVLKLRDNIQRTGYIDPTARHHKHNDLNDIEWWEPKDIEAGCGIEWIYIMDVQANLIHVATTRYVSTTAKHPYQKIGEMTFAEAPNFQVLECGAEFERCGHYAWKHFPELPEESRLGTQKYIGRKPMIWDDAIAFTMRGQRYTRTGSGMTGGIALRYGHYGFSDSNGSEFVENRWYEDLIRESDGHRVKLPVAVDTKRGRRKLRSIQAILPPTLMNTQEQVLR